jgi:hypothetical protein
MPRPADSRTERAASSPDVREAADDSVARLHRRVEERRAARASLRSTPERRLAEYGAQCRRNERRRIERLAP